MIVQQTVMNYQQEHGVRPDVVILSINDFEKEKAHIVDVPESGLPEGALTVSYLSRMNFRSVTIYSSPEVKDGQPVALRN